MIDFDTSLLTKRQIGILKFLAEKPRGLPIYNKHIELFGDFEGSGLVKLSAAICGPLRLPELDTFWAKMTPFGLLVLEKINFGWVP